MSCVVHVPGDIPHKPKGTRAKFVRVRRKACQPSRKSPSPGYLPLYHAPGKIRKIKRLFVFLASQIMYGFHRAFAIAVVRSSDDLLYNPVGLTAPVVLKTEESKEIIP
jgi:hypothetical protein